MPMKNTRGFSYIEVLIAMALFAIAMLAVIPTLSQSARNMTYAQDAYAGHLQAQRMMLVVRDALTDNADVRVSAINYAANRFEFSVWISGRNAQEIHSSYCVIEGANASAVVTEINTTMSSHASTIITAVWCEDGHLLGRAIGMLYYD